MTFCLIKTKVVAIDFSSIINCNTFPVAPSIIKDNVKIHCSIQLGSIPARTSGKGVTQLKTFIKVKNDPAYSSNSQHPTGIRIELIVYT